MAVLDRDGYFNRINDYIAEDTSDAAISLLEDLTDTYNDLERRLTDGEDWEKRFKENDAAWRKKYQQRFYNGSSAIPPEVVEETDGNEDILIEDLFTE